MEAEVHKKTWETLEFPHNLAHGGFKNYVIVCGL